MLEKTMPVGIDAVVGECAKIKVAGFRFVTMSCAAIGDQHVDILYHFDKDLQLKHLRLTVARDTSIPSISAVYFAAFLVENEIQDLFGIRFEGLAIDYDRTLYLEEEITSVPLCKYTVAKPSGESTQQPLGSGESLSLEER